MGVLRRVFEVDRLAGVFDGQQRAERVGQPLEDHVDRRGEDVQVRGVQHDDQEGQRHPDVQQQGRRFDDLVGGLAERAKDGGEQVREERSLAVGQGAVVDRRPADERVGPDDVEDHEKDQPGAAGVGSVEARRTADFPRAAEQADDREGGDAEEDGGREEILQESERVRPADDRDVEVRREEQPVGLDVDREQDEEAPHGEEVRHSGDRPLQQTALAENLGDLRPDSPTGVIAVPEGRSPGPDQVDQEQDPASRERGDEQRHAQAHGEPDEHLGGHRRSPQHVGCQYLS